MATSKKKERFIDRDKHTLEFTPAQLLGAIVTLMIFGLGCFLLGVVVNKVDNARSGRNVQSAEQSSQPAAGEPEGTQTTPRVETARVQETEPAAKPPRTVTVPPKKDELRPVPLPGQSEPKAQEKSEKAAVKVELPKTEPAKPKGTENTEVASATPESAPKPDSTESAQADTSPAEPAAAETSPNTDEANFAIQVISFGASNRSQAEEFLQLLEKQTDLKGRLAESADGKYLRVLVGSFADRESAERKRAELRQIKQFQDCIVKSLN